MTPGNVIPTTFQVMASNKASAPLRDLLAAAPAMVWALKDARRALEWFLEHDDASLATTVDFAILLARIEWALEQAGES